MKRCPDCGTERPNKAFVKDASRKDGLSHYCQRHMNERKHKHRTKFQPTEAIFHVVNREPRSDLSTELLNRQAAREERKPCVHEGCITRVRYRSVYAPYCEVHRHEGRRAS